MGFICETDAVRDNWLAWFPGAKVQTIPVAIKVPGQIAEKSEARKALGLPIVGGIFLIFGTHRADKDYRTIIRAAKLCPERPHLLFAGPLISENDPRLVVEEENFSSATVLNQFFFGKAVDDLFAASDAVILPYPTNYQKGSAVLLQSPQYLRPVLATDGIFFGRFVPAHGIGLLYQYGNVEQLAQRMSQLVQLAQVGEGRLPFEEGLRATRAEYSWERMAALYLAAFLAVGSHG
jgi:glycosyltransferase involved in cell wall biosynthesis